MNNSCKSRFHVKGTLIKNSDEDFTREIGGFDIDCLLQAPHPGRRHYHAAQDDPRRFWTWEDETELKD